ncbi:PAS domain-containing protein [Neorhizobium sp. JUb45]|uniref:PAS domain-containing protein n=1 Tax=unclassified Neorhizobium TaxID=2629175 RepID=UPI0010519472|nr:PAS domain-containing protein [Neorhizobium sp. JUb45]TCR03090.1 aerotaxis receptor [Neorhizobium sp. JUb45]
MRDQDVSSKKQFSLEREIPLDFAELFFSRTDERGKIQAGNTVFQKISGFCWQELLGKPHNIVRHPDMPRAVFQLLWDRLRQNRPTGAYVKNRAKDGRYYWVYAIISPIAAGYMSVRMKPSSALLPIVLREYADLLKAEETEGLSPSQSAQRLLQRLSALGFSSYDGFMGASLTAELASRSGHLQKDAHPAVALYGQLMSASKLLLEAASTIAAGYQRYRFVPLNLTVQASRLGDTGKAISTISNNYEELSGQIRLGLDKFIAATERVSQAVHQGAFLLATSEIQDEIATIFDGERPLPYFDHVSEAALLKQQRDRYRQDAVRTVFDVQREVRRFAEEVFEIKRLSAGLAAIRVMGKVEAGYLETAVLSDLLADLQAFQDILRSGLDDILSLNDVVKVGVAQLTFGKPLFEEI